MKKKSDLQWFLIHRKLERIMHQNRKKEEKIIYLFLDFDGVINRFYLEGTPEYEEMLKKSEFEFADRKCIERLNRLYHDFPLRLILSSSWRFSGIPYCTEYLRKAGLDQDVEFYGMTDIESFRPREEEIVDYLFEHPDFAGFGILDDIDMKHLKAYEAMTDGLKGLDEEKDLEIRKIFTGFLI